MLTMSSRYSTCHIHVDDHVNGSRVGLQAVLSSVLFSRVDATMEWLIPCRMPGQDVWGRGLSKRQDPPFCLATGMQRSA